MDDRCIAVGHMYSCATHGKAQTVLAHTVATAYCILQQPYKWKSTQRVSPKELKKLFHLSVSLKCLITFNVDRPGSPSTCYKFNMMPQSIIYLLSESLWCSQTAPYSGHGGGACGRPYEKYKANQSLALGITQIIIGVLCIILNIVGIILTAKRDSYDFFDDFTFYIGYGMWPSFFVSVHLCF